MNRIRRICRSLSGMPRRVGALFASAAAAPTALATAPPLPLGHVAGPAYKVPATIPAHTTVTGGMPGWQITLITATAVLLAAALALSAYRMRSGRPRVGTSTAEVMTALDAPTPTTSGAGEAAGFPHLRA
jgi:hypothetical protein